MLMTTMPPPPPPWPMTMKMMVAVTAVIICIAYNKRNGKTQQRQQQQQNLHLWSPIACVVSNKTNQFDRNQHRRLSSRSNNNNKTWAKFLIGPFEWKVFELYVSSFTIQTIIATIHACMLSISTLQTDFCHWFFFVFLLEIFFVGEKSSSYVSLNFFSANFGKKFRNAQNDY